MCGFLNNIMSQATNPWNAMPSVNMPQVQAPMTFPHRREPMPTDATGGDIYVRNTDRMGVGPGGGANQSNQPGQANQPGRTNGQGFGGRALYPLAPFAGMPFNPIAALLSAFGGMQANPNYPSQQGAPGAQGLQNFPGAHAPQNLQGPQGMRNPQGGRFMGLPWPMSPYGNQPYAGTPHGRMFYGMPTALGAPSTSSAPTSQSGLQQPMPNPYNWGIGIRGY